MYRVSVKGFRYTIEPFDSLWHLAQRFHTTVEEICVANPTVNPYNLFIGQMITIPGVSRMETLTYPILPSHCISKTEIELMTNMRLIWEQHVTWTRMAIISLVFGLPDVEFVLARLLRNAIDNGNSLEPFYGEQIGEKYEELIREHLLIAAELVKAAIAGNQAAVASLDKKWHTNADEIANFLSSINPYIQKEEFRKMFYKHLALTKNEAVQMIQKDFEASIKVFDEIEEQAMEMADEIMTAIIKQFPQMFMTASH